MLDIKNKKFKTGFIFKKEYDKNGFVIIKKFFDKKLPIK